MGAMKSGIEACDLRNVGKSLEYRVNRREIMGLTKRRQRHELVEVCQNLFGHYCGSSESSCTMYDAMSNTQHSRAAILGAEPCCQRFDRCSSITDRRVQLAVSKLSALGIFDREPR